MNRIKPLLPYLIFLVVVILWVGNMIFATCNFPASEHRGQFGDMFGAVNALFAGFAFAGVIWAIILQKRGLELQGQQFQEQNFESSFFQLLRFHSESVNSMPSGRENFSKILSRLESIIEIPAENFYIEMLADRDEGKQNLLERLNSKYEEFFAEDQSNIGYYFRNLYNVVKFVHKHDFPKEFETRKSYTNLIRAQLSSDELVLLFYNCLSGRGSEFKILAEEYALLKDMPLEKDIRRKLKELFYEERAFGESD